LPTFQRNTAFRPSSTILRTGNGDGIVCAKPLSAAEQAARFPNEDVVIFDFRDNTLTPSH